MRFRPLYFLLLIVTIFLVKSATAGLVDTTSYNPDDRKGKFFAYWGWNHSWYTHSDIHFTGDNYDFTLADVQAKDRQSPFGLDPYFNPSRVTIPQYNIRIGFFFDNHNSISIGADHMKYVMVGNQPSTIDGTISGTGTLYDGVYSDEPIMIRDSLLLFEHTDGLNYINVEYRREQNLFSFKISNKQFIDFNGIAGAGAGILFPKTNCTLLNNERYDEFHVAGFGIDALVGLNITFLKHFFIQFEGKGGYINMGDIRTTSDVSDKASQHFFYLQTNYTFGGRFRLWK